MDVPESAIVLAYSDQHPTIRHLDATTASLDDSNSTSRGSSTYEYILLTIGGVAAVLLHASSIALLGIGRLPEFFQVLPPLLPSPL
jgi:hypothetical protein